MKFTLGACAKAAALRPRNAAVVKAVVLMGVMGKADYRREISRIFTLSMDIPMGGAASSGVGAMRPAAKEGHAGPVIKVPDASDGAEDSSVGSQNPSGSTASQTFCPIRAERATRRPSARFARL